MLEKHDRKPIREIGLFSGERHGGSPIGLLKSVRLDVEAVERHVEVQNSEPVQKKANYSQVIFVCIIYILKLDKMRERYILNQQSSLNICLN